MEEVAPAPEPSRARRGVGWSEAAGGGGGAAPRSLAGVAVGEERVIPTGNDEVDGVLGGGLRPGSVTLLAGEPGVGKSTLALQALMQLASAGEVVLLASAEEELPQIRRRAERLGPVPEALFVAATASVAEVVRAAGARRPAALVVDSVQTMAAPDLASPPGAVPQVTRCLEALTDLARSSGTAVIIIGHVTKDGRLAGPRQLEHLVDTVLWLEGDRHGPLRFLRAVKQRHAPTARLGVLEMGGGGLAGAADPSALLLRERRATPGSVVVPLLEGGRPLLVEIQALVPGGELGRSRDRAGRLRTHGLERTRVLQTLAVLDAVAGSCFSERAVFVSSVGGMQVRDPAADLAVALAVVTAALDACWPADAVAVGEVALTGALRSVLALDRRLADARRLGFGRALVPGRPGNAGRGGDGPVLRRTAATLGEALSLAAAMSAGDPPGAAEGCSAPPGSAAPRASLTAGRPRGQGPSAPPHGREPTAGGPGTGGTMPRWWSTTATSR